jgi:hypothetical protein
VVKVTLKGVHKVTAKGRVYWYAWRGPPLGPRLRGDPGSPEFIASYHEAHESLRTPETARFRSLVVLYRAGPFRNLAPSTQKNWSPWLDRIAGHFGGLRVEQFNRPERIRPIIRQWRSQYAETPRTADFGMQVLSVVLAHAVDQGTLASNP